MAYPTVSEVRKLALEHVWQGITGGFWFKRSYERILGSLPRVTPSVWVEVGVYHGCSISWLGVEVINRGLPVLIHAVDSFQGWPGVLQGPPLRAAFDHNTAEIRKILGGNFRVTALPSVEAARGFEDESCDVIWIDADHSYQAVKDDIAAWWPKLKPGGVMGGDDYMMAGVAFAVHERFGEQYTMLPGWRKDVEYEGPWPSWLVRR